MCGISGWIYSNSEKCVHPESGMKNVKERKTVVEQMNYTMRRRGPDENNIWISKTDICIFGHSRLIVVDPQGGKQPMSRQDHNGDTYTIVYDGQLYNTEELRQKLIEKGYQFKGYSDTEIVLTCFMEWNDECVNYMNGIFAFAIWNENEESLFIARDRLGVKPLFYSTFENNGNFNGFAFASEIKGLLQHPNVSSDVPFEYLSKIFVSAMIRLPGFVPFKDIKEFESGHFGKVTKEGLVVSKYWNFEALPYNDNLDEASLKIYYLLKDATEKQMVSDVPFGSLLSGGIDSSSIVNFMFHKLHNNQKEPINLQTFSLGLPGYEEHFTPTGVRRTNDMYFTQVMVDKYGLNQRYISMTSEELMNTIEECTIAKDYPLYGDIDTSMLLMFRSIKKHATMVLSGEGSDEIFAGYGYLFKDTYFSTICGNTSHYDLILKNEINEKLNLKNQAKKICDEIIQDCPMFEEDTNLEQEFRRRIYLHIKNFLCFTLEILDRTSMWSGVEARVPFTDHDLMQYAFQIPIGQKYHDGIEKVVLRKAMENDVKFPEEIRTRKKSPYPAVVDPKSKSLAIELLKNLLKNPNEPIFQFFDINKIENKLKTSFENMNNLFCDPTTLIAMNLCSINYWFKVNNVNVI